MTELWKAIGIALALWCLLSAAVTVVYILAKHWPLISLGAATPTPAAAEGTGARPVCESGGTSPCAAPPQDASRPNRHYGHYQFTVRDGEPFRVGGQELAEQVESTTYDDEVQP